MNIHRVLTKGISSAKMSSSMSGRSGAGKIMGIGSLLSGWDSPFYAPGGRCVPGGDEALYARARRPMPPPPPEKRKRKRQAQPACRLLDQPIQNFERRIKTNDVDPMILALFVSQKSKVRSVMI